MVKYNDQIIMVKVFKISIILCMMSLLCCCKDDELSIKRVPYTGNELRTDGYYYEMGGNGQIWNTFFFYRDGVVLNGGSGNVGMTLEDMDNNFQSEAFRNSIGKYSWGVFVINGDNITINRWTYSPGLGSGLPTLLQKGKIVNDTTFYLEQGEQQLYHHFRHFYPKPDSTAANKWIN
jgi:hypothetical protein